MDWASSELIVHDNSESDNFGLLREPSREANVDELQEYSEGTKLVRLAILFTEGEVFEAFPRLAESDHRFMSLACEYLQVLPFSGEQYESLETWFDLCLEQKLNFFRLAQRIRDEHGTTRENSPPNCFQSFEDIVELERSIEIDDCVEFMTQCMRLNLVDARHFYLMFKNTYTVEQLAALYDESVLMLEKYQRYGHKKETTTRSRRTFNQCHLGGRFGVQFTNLMRTLPCKRPLWRDIKMYFERAYALYESDVIIFDVDIPDADVDEALSCLLSNAALLWYGDCVDEFAHLSKSLLSRGASLYHRDQHGVSSLRRLLGHRYLCIEDESLRTLLTYFCCPLKKEDAKIVADNRRVAPLSCLAARRIPPSTIEEQLPSQLRPFVKSHQELQGMLAGNIRSPEPVDEWRLEGKYDHSDYRCDWDDPDDLYWR